MFIWLCFGATLNLCVYHWTRKVTVVERGNTKADRKLMAR